MPKSKAIYHLISTFVCLLLIVSCGGGGGGDSDQTPAGTEAYDGSDSRWFVSFTSTSGEGCKNASGTLFIRDYQIDGYAWSEWGQYLEISGYIDEAGRGEIYGYVSQYGSSATGSGMITLNSGNGTWSDSDGCSGTWTATRLEPEAPTITSATLYKGGDDGLESEADVLHIGDKVNVKITASDPDIDMQTLYYSMYLLPNETTPYYGPFSANILQTYTTSTYHLVEPLTVEGPIGRWRIKSYIVDSVGNESDEVSIDIITMPITTVTVKLTGISSGTTVDRVDITIDYDETKVRFVELDEGTLTLGSSTVDYDNGVAVRGRTSFYNDFDGGANGSILVFTFDVLDYQNLPTASDFEIITFSAENYPNDLGLTSDNVILDVVTQ